MTSTVEKFDRKFILSSSQAKLSQPKTCLQLSKPRRTAKKPNYDCSCRDLVRSLYKGSGCDSVGRTVDSETRDPRFESSHQQILN